MDSVVPVDRDLQISSVRLAVADLQRSAQFYERVLGLPLISREERRALLGMDPRHPALELVAIDEPMPLSPHSTGLFHVAWLHPSRGALAATVQRVLRGRWPIGGVADHGVSEALYLSDPDGLGIEIYADRPREQWEHPAGGRGVRIVTLPLDLDDLMAQAPPEPERAMPAGTAVGHVHLKVADVPRALAFYRDALGLEEQAQLPSAAFVSAGGYHHHVGLNSWQSRGASTPPDSAPGLRLVEFEMGAAEAVDALRERVAQSAPGAPVGEPVEHSAPGSLQLADPDGNRLSFSAPPVATLAAG